MTVHHFLIVALAALPLMTSEAAAQDAGRYRAWYRNRDGVITRSEWRGAQQTFRELEWNRDGVLSGDEMLERGWESTVDDSLADTFANLDANNDGRISRAEWRGERAAFRRTDRNADNLISRGEFMNANVAYDDLDVTDLAGLDDDGNGRVDRREWNGTVATFNRLDVNRDGVLTARELAANDVTPARSDDFETLDYNNNGVITAIEWRNSFGNFNRFDTNRDGVVTRREFSLAEADGGVMHHTVRVDARAPWTNTGIYVNAGDVVTYQAQGVIQMSTNAEDRATPAGALSGRTARNAPRLDQKAGVLLLRIGGVLQGVVGNNGSFTAQQSGELQFGVNDDHFPDNSGEYSVSLSVQKVY